MNIECISYGDYFVPNVKAPERPDVGIWGQRRHKYLREYQKVLYTEMLLTGNLSAHLEEIDQSASEMFDMLVAQVKIRDGITEKLKVTDQMEWVRRMKTIRKESETVVTRELIYE